MVLAGVALILVGLVVAMPSDGAQGSAARTIVRQGGHIWQTRGARRDDVTPRPWWHSVLRGLAGLGLIALGLWLIVLGTDNDSV